MPQLTVPQILKQANLLTSTSDGMRMMRQRAVKIDGVVVIDEKMLIDAPSAHVYQVGKRIVARIHLV